MDFKKAFEAAKMSAIALIIVGLVSTAISTMPTLLAIWSIISFVLTLVLLGYAGFTAKKMGLDLAGGALAGAIASVISTVVNGVITLVLLFLGFAPSMLAASPALAEAGLTQAVMIGILLSALAIGTVIGAVIGAVVGAIGTFLYNKK